MAGVKARKVNQYSAFFTAGLGGTRQILQTLSTVRGSATFLSYVLLPEIINLLVNQDDDEYEKIPEYEKERSWHIPLKYVDGEGFIKIPKPR